MTVSELIETLQQFDPDNIVILQKDPEGNGYSPLESAWEGIYVGTDHGEAYARKLSPQDIEEGYTEEDLYHGNQGQNAVILYPLA